MKPTQPNSIFEKVKGFLIRLVKDESFASHLQDDSPETVQQTLKSLGYTFTAEEFEDATLQILDLKEKGEFQELTEAELVGAVGGSRFDRWAWRPPTDRQYWWRERPRPTPKPFPKPLPIDDPIIQPLYGVVVDPPVVINPPFVQPLYGVVIAEDLL